MDPYVGEIRLVGFTFAPTGWALCRGQTLAIAQNTALFSLLGIQFGGDGRTTFNLPNLQGNIAINQGQGPGLQNYGIGQAGGSTTVSLNINQLSAHTHALPVDATAAPLSAPSSTSFLGGATRPPVNAYATPAIASSQLVPMAGGMVQGMGGGAPHNNMAPYCVLNYIIALQGIFPPRP